MVTVIGAEKMRGNGHWTFDLTDNVDPSRTGSVSGIGWYRAALQHVMDIAEQLGYSTATLREVTR